MKDCDNMVLCPVCNKENNDEKYCTDCGTKLVNEKTDPIFEFDENKDISNINELNSYFNELNKKINQQKKFLDELKNDPLIKKYETISKINDENNELREKVDKLEDDNEKISLELNESKKKNLKLQSEIVGLKSGSGGISGAIRGIFGGNKNNFCPHCGRKLS